MDLYLIFTAIIFLIILISIFLYGYKNFTLIILMILLSPFIPSFLSSNELIWRKEATEAGLHSYIRAALISISGLFGLLKFLLSPAKTHFPKSFIYLCCFLLLAFISIIYSIDTTTTFQRATLFLMVFFFSLGLYKYLEDNNNLIKVINLLFFYFSLFVIACLFSLLVPGRSWWVRVPSRFIGIGSEPNFTGDVIMISILFSLWKLSKVKLNMHKLLVLFLILISIILLLLTGSRTSIIALFGAIPVYYITQKKITKLLLLILILVFMGSFSLLFLNMNDTSLARGDKGVTTLTGRQSIWAGAVIAIKERPIQGYGYMVENKIWVTKKLVDLQQDWFNVSPQQPLHNGFLSIAVGNGLVGLALWIWMIFSPFTKLIKTNYAFNNLVAEYKPLLLSMFTLLIITNLSTSYLTGYLQPGDIVFWIIFVATIRINESVNRY